MKDVPQEELNGVLAKIRAMGDAAESGELDSSHYRAVDQAVANVLQQLSPIYRISPSSSQESMEEETKEGEPRVQVDPASCKKFEQLLAQHKGPLRNLVTNEETLGVLTGLFPTLQGDELSKMLTAIEAVRGEAEVHDLGKQEVAAASGEGGAKVRHVPPASKSLAKIASFASQSGHGFFDKVESRVEEVDSLLMVGLDPHAAELGEGNNNAAGAKAFCLRIISATSTVAVGYKPNAAFFEAFGAEGVAALKEVIAAVPEGIPVLLDAKRGDIGTTATAYASGAFEVLGAHAITLNAYMGVDTVDPFLKDPAKGVFVLCKTSNKSSNELQTLSVGSSGKALFEEVASLCQSWNKDNNVGLVVGATDAEALARVRAAAPDLWILAPGVGAQGGDLDEACSAALDKRGMGLLVPVSRGISRADDPAAEAVALKDRINAARKRCADQRNEPTAEASTTTTTLLPYQREFIEFSMSHKVLKFGDFSKGGQAFFELKSKRMSPYFFNAGLFYKGSALAKLGKFYAQAIVNARPPLEFDVIFGPAYKGIPLGAAVAYTLADLHDRDVGFSYNRKEPKDHGEGGLLVGEDLKGKRVLVVDDVITAGTAIREAFGILREMGATPTGVVITLDRQEKTGAEGVIGTTSAVQQVVEECGVPVVSVVGMSHLTEYMASKENATPGANAQALEAMRAYRAKYGVG